MYQLISSINSIIREEIMPNPFSFISSNEIVVILFFSLFGSKLLHTIVFNMCGIFYISKSNKTLGSIGYMFFYYINIQVLLKLNELFNNVALIMIIYIITVVCMFGLLNKAKNKINEIIV